MFTEAEKAEITSVKERLLKMVDYQFMAGNATMPGEIYTMVKRGILTGGAIASAFHNEKPNDFDIYFNRHDDIQYVADYFLKKDNQMWITKLQHDYIQPVVPGLYYTNNAITLQNGIQFIILQTANLRGVFDFVHCMPWIDMETGKMHISEDQYRAIKNKKLIMNPGGHSPSASRITKYVERGYAMSDQVKKLLETYTANSLAAQPPAPEPLEDVIADVLSREFQEGMQKALADSYEESLKKLYADSWEQPLKIDIDEDVADYDYTYPGKRLTLI